MGTCVEYCPACGQQQPLATEPQTLDTDEDFYDILGLPSSAPAAQIRASLAENTRVWSSRSNNAPLMEDRHKAERLLRVLEKAELILLNPSSRSAYDETLRARKSRRDALPVPRPFPTSSDSRRSEYKRPQEPPRQDGVPPAEVIDESPSAFSSLFGWKKLSGTVIALDPPYLSKPERSLARVIGGLVIGVLLIPFVIGAVAAVMLVHFSFSILRPRVSRQPSAFSSLGSQVLGFLLTGKLFGPKEQVTVRDVRLRTLAGGEQLVRIRGELVAGNLNVGDEAEVEGFDRHGTLMFRRGRNKRTRSEIVVKYR
jgi:hypothetical protein